MVELWQAVLLLGAGTLLALGSGYVQRLWAKSDTLDADKRAFVRLLEQEEREAARKKEWEEREATRQKEAEERESTRQWRRERVKPLQDFIEVAKRYMAGESANALLDSAWQKDIGGVKDKLSLEDWRKAVRESPAVVGPDYFEVMQALVVAIPTALGKPKMTARLIEAFFAVIGKANGESKPGLAKQARAIASLERLVQDYVTKV
jgi:hypothetical protein